MEMKPPPSYEMATVGTMAQSQESAAAPAAAAAAPSTAVVSNWPTPPASDTTSLNPATTPRRPLVPGSEKISAYSSNSERLPPPLLAAPPSAPPYPSHQQPIYHIPYSGPTGYGIPLTPYMQHPGMPPPPPPPNSAAPNIVITNTVQGGAGGAGGGANPDSGKLAKRQCPRCIRGIVVKRRHKCLKTMIIILSIVLCPFGCLLCPLMCCIWQNSCEHCESRWGLGCN